MNYIQRHTVLFQALDHPVRMQILEILSQGPSCVCDFVALTGKRHLYISQHLATLRNAGLVTAVWQALSICYQLNDPRLSELEQLISTLIPSVRNTCSAIKRINI